MNTLKSGLVIFSLIVGSTAMAQDKEGKSPQERAQFRTDWMAKELSLTTEQKDKIASVNLQSIEKTREIRKNESLTAEQKKEALVDFRKAQKAELKSILTAEQLVTLKSKREEFNSKHKEGRKMQGEHKKMSSQEKAQARMEKMNQELSLTAEQQTQVLELNLKTIEENEAIRKDIKLTSDERKAAMQVNHKAQKEEFKKLLTASQLEILKTKKAHFHEKHQKNK